MCRGTAPSTVHEENVQLWSNRGLPAAVAPGHAAHFAVMEAPFEKAVCKSQLASHNSSLLILTVASDFFMLRPASSSQRGIQELGFVLPFIRGILKVM